MDPISLFQVIYIFIIPISLVFFKAISYKYRFHTLTIISLGTFLIMIYENWTLKDMAIRFDNLSEALIPYIIFTIIGVMFLITISEVSNKRMIVTKAKYFHLMFLFLPVSFLQEFLFRSFLIPKLLNIFSDAFVVIMVNALLFMYLHSIYSNNALSLFITLIAGIGFSIMYLFYPNLILLTISHSFLNFFAILYGYFFREKRNKITFKHLMPFQKPKWAN